MDGGTAIDNSTAGANVQAAGIKAIRWQMWKPPCDLRATDCQTTAQFNHAIDGIRRLGAEPVIGLPPIWDQQCTGAADPWSYAWQQWIVRTAGSRVKLYEMANEPNNYCGYTGQSYYDGLWAPNVPALKAYARSLGLTIYMGGPSWSNSYPEDVSQFQTFLTDTKNGYLSHGNNRDYIPDFIASHTYLITPSENDTQADAQSRINQWGTFYDSLRSVIGTTFSGLTDRGYAISSEIKLADTEYNDTINNGWSGNNSQAWTDFYMGAMFKMLKAHGVWLANQFTIASHGGGALDLLNTDGTPKPLYNSYRAQTG